MSTNSYTTYLVAEYSSICLQSLLYGVFLCLFSTASYFAIWQQHGPDAGSTKRRIIHRIPLFISIACLFVTVTTHFVLEVKLSCDALVYSGGGQAALDAYETLGNPVNLAQIAAMFISLAVCDAFLIYRLWVVWARGIRVTFFPSLTFVASVACCVVTVWKLSYLKAASDIGLFTSMVGPWISADVVLTLLTNCYCSGLIAWKLWRMRNFVHFRRSGQLSVSWYLGMLIEAAALYVGIIILYFVVHLSGSPVQFFIQDAISPLSGITFMLINVRVGMGYSLHSPPTRPSTSEDRMNRSGTIALHPVAINVTQTVVQDNDGQFHDAKQASLGGGSVIDIRASSA